MSCAFGLWLTLRFCRYLWLPERGVLRASLGLKWTLSLRIGQVASRSRLSTWRSEGLLKRVGRRDAFVA